MLDIFTNLFIIDHSLLAYLSGWHDMRQQVNDDRIRARQLLYISQEIIKVKLRLDEELAHFDSIHHFNHPWLDDTSLIELMRRINYEIESEKDSRQVKTNLIFYIKLWLFYFRNYLPIVQIYF